MIYLMIFSLILNFIASSTTTTTTTTLLVHVAASEGHIEVVRVLLNAGASNVVRDRWNQTPYDAAIENNYKAVAAALKIDD